MRDTLTSDLEPSPAPLVPPFSPVSLGYLIGGSCGSRTGSRLPMVFCGGIAQSLCQGTLEPASKEYSRLPSVLAGFREVEGKDEVTKHKLRDRS